MQCYGYVFSEYDNDYRPGETSFSPTQMKNYPIQGFATGDIVPEVLGRLYRAIKEKKLDDKILTIGTVHDSIVLDVEYEYVGVAELLVKDIMERAPEWMMERYGIYIDVPLKADVSIADNWAETK